MGRGDVAVLRLLSWKLSIALLLAAMAAGAQVPGSAQNTQPPGNPPGANTTSTASGETAPTPDSLKSGVTINGKKIQTKQPLPKLPPNEFRNCADSHDMGASQSGLPPDFMAIETCQLQLESEKNVLLRACVDVDGKTAPNEIIQACTESLAHDVVPDDEDSFLYANRAQAYFALGNRKGAFDDYDAAVKSARFLPANERYAVFASRAGAYFATGDKQHALDDYNAAIQSAPHNAALFYNRGVVLASQANYPAALQNFDTALGFNSKFVPALLQRGKIYASRGNLTGALADYSEAIRLQPKTAESWSDRGYVDLSQRDYSDAVKDEAQAIQLDPKLARAYYLRGVAFGDLGNRTNAVGDLQTAVGLDGSLAHYVLIQGKNVTLTLPPL
jgi:tetratricopeptide (TPR) repeat protein